jgi:hypothetical protein
MADRHGVALRSRPAVAWPPDDTEESVLGTNLHQGTITNLRLGLNEAAVGATPPGGPAPWQALSQTAISGLRRGDGSSYTVLPDVFVMRQPIDERRATLTLEQDGAPLLIAELLSPTTARSDLDLEKGKGYSYALAGVAEYLIVDPTGEYLTERIQGWRLADGVYVPWRPDARGRWRSRMIAVSIGFEGARIAVYSGMGRRLLREGEIERELAVRERRRVADLAEKDRQREELGLRMEREHAEELARKDEELTALRRRLEQLEQGT